MRASFLKPILVKPLNVHRLRLWEEKASACEEIPSHSSGCHGAGGEAELYSVPGKGHAMIGSEPEMRAIMGFWSRHLKAGPPKSAGDFVEVQNRA